MICSPRRARTRIVPGSAGHLGGRGKTAGRGTKGQTPAPAATKRPYFEGGQLPLVRRLPHLGGFTNIWRVEYAPVNVERLNVFPAGTEVTPEMMAEAGLDQVGRPRRSRSWATASWIAR